MFENVKNGFRAANATRKLVLSDRELFLYPILSVVISVVIAVAVIALALLAVLALGPAAKGAPLVILVLVFLFILVLAVTYVTTYLTMAMLIAFREHSKKKHISFGEAMHRTGAYNSLIAEWSLFYTVIYMVIHTIEAAIGRLFSRRGIGGNMLSDIITGGLNIALAAAVAFALPVILDEKKGPVDTLRSGASFVLKNFGDTFGGLLFTELYFLIFLVIGIVLVLVPLLFFPSSTLGSIFALILIALGIILIIVGALLRYVLFNCFKLIIYEYKTKRTLPKGFDAKLIDNSIKRNSQSRDDPPRPTPFSFGMGQQGNI